MKDKQTSGSISFSKSKDNMRKYNNNVFNWANISLLIYDDIFDDCYNCGVKTNE